jgi:hypothetical protein
MTPKEYLQQYRICCRKHSATIESIEQLRSIAEKTTQAITGDRVSSSASDRLGNIASILADAETEAFEELEALIAKKKEISLAIENTVLICTCNKNCICADKRDVLYHRYILQKKWEQIAADLSFDYSWILDLHGQALQKITISDNTLQ